MKPCKNLLLTLISIFLLSTTPAFAFAVDWYDSNWEYAKKIIVNSAQVDSDLIGFPVFGKPNRH